MQRVELTVGETRTFSFSNTEFTVREVIENPQIRLTWVWTDTICPHCKERINREIQHDIYYIEILGESATTSENLQLSQLVVLGHTKDNRLMQLPQDKYQEVFQLSKTFRRFIT